MPTGIQHVFVLMLENHSFDHMLGFCDVSGTDAVSGGPTRINGLISPPAGAVTSNMYNGQQFRVTQRADYAMPVDPGHEFPAILEQPCGPGGVYTKGGAYPAILNTGFVVSYAAASAAVGVQGSPGEIMKCYNTATQLPVLNALARKFVVCDNWFSSLPGDTAPNVRYNQYGFTFEQYGARVPAIAISPLISPNLIDHRTYDHSSILATVEACFGLYAMTERDARANNLTPLLSLSSAADGAPTELPSPVNSGIGGCEPYSCSSPRTLLSLPPTRSEESINDGNLPGIMRSVMRQDLALSPPEQREAIIARFESLRTRADAWKYKTEVQEKIRAARGGQ